MSPYRQTGPTVYRIVDAVCTKVGVCTTLENSLACATCDDVDCGEDEYVEISPKINKKGCLVVFDSVAYRHVRPHGGASYVQISISKRNRIDRRSYKYIHHWAFRCRYRTGSCGGHGGVGSVRDNGFKCTACPTCGPGEVRAGECSGTTNTVTCTPKDESQACPGADQYRDTGAGGACKQCDNAVCGADEYRDGACGGTVNGYRCAKCANAICPDTAVRTGTCAGTVNAWTCEARGAAGTSAPLATTAALSPGGAFDAKPCDMNPGPLVNADGKPNMMASQHAVKKRGGAGFLISLASLRHTCGVHPLHWGKCVRVEVQTESTRPPLNLVERPLLQAVMPLLTGKKEEFKADMGGKVSPLIMLLAMSDKCTSAIMDPTVQKLLTGGP